MNSNQYRSQREGTELYFPRIHGNLKIIKLVHLDGLDFKRPEVSWYYFKKRLYSRQGNLHLLILAKDYWPIINDMSRIKIRIERRKDIMQSNLINEF